MAQVTQPEEIPLNTPPLNPQCEALVVTCMDFRFQPLLEHWLDVHVGPGNYDRIAYPGAAKDREVIVPLVELARDLHRIDRVVLVNHDDCGAYGPLGRDRARHAADLRAARDAIRAAVPGLRVDLYFASLTGDYRDDPLDGTLERIE